MLQTLGVRNTNCELTIIDLQILDRNSAEPEAKCRRTLGVRCKHCQRKSINGCNGTDNLKRNALRTLGTHAWQRHLSICNVPIVHLRMVCGWLGPIRMAVAIRAIYTTENSWSEQPYIGNTCNNIMSSAFDKYSNVIRSNDQRKLQAHA